MTEIRQKIREKKDLFRQRRRLGVATRTTIDAAEAPQKISLYTARARNFLEFVSLSPEQMVTIPRDKQGIFLETMRKIFLEAEDVVSNLSQFIMEDGYADNADTVVTLNIICKVSRTSSMTSSDVIPSGLEKFRRTFARDECGRAVASQRPQKEHVPLDSSHCIRDSRRDEHIADDR